VAGVSGTVDIPIIIFRTHDWNDNGTNSTYHCRLQISRNSGDNLKRDGKSQFAHKCGRNRPMNRSLEEENYDGKRV
jgi:hypothetical protein